MKKNIAVISKNALNHQFIDTAVHSDHCYDNTDSGWRFYDIDEDDHLLNQIESIVLMPLEELLNLFPALAQILDVTENAEFAYREKDATFIRIDG